MMKTILEDVEGIVEARLIGIGGENTNTNNNNADSSNTNAGNINDLSPCGSSTHTGAALSALAQIAGGGSSTTCSSPTMKFVVEGGVRRQLSMGLTGETWYDFDLPLSREDPITIIHFNDVYNIEADADGSGGISRFITAVREHSGEHPLILFSGDAFNPSTLSTHTRGRHMVPFLNMTKIHTACFGNHDFDFGIDHLEYLAGGTRFPWVISNVFEKATHDPLANGALYRLFEWQGIRIAVFGLVEQEWLETLACVDQEELEYEDFVESGRKMSRMLREKEAELIIALTHMRAPNDEKLAKDDNDIDIILGGHDHDYYGVKKINNTIVCKSGTDFREFTKMVIKPGAVDDTLRSIETAELEIEKQNSNESDCILVPGNKGAGMYVLDKLCGGSLLEWEYVEVSPHKYKPNVHVDIMVDKYIKDIHVHMDKIVGELAVPLETRFSIIRTQETNAGNWFCDLMRRDGRTEIAILNSGTIRSDCVFKPGVLRMRHLSSMLPMNDPLVVLGVTGKVLLDVLENGVSMVPKLEGRFLQVSGVKFAYRVNPPEGETEEKEKKETEEKEKNNNNKKFRRVVEDSVKVLNTQTNEYENLDKEREYTMITKEYLYEGKDGFDALSTCRVIRESEIVPSLPTMVRNTLTLAAMANGYKKPHTRMMTKMLHTFTTMDAHSLVHDHGVGKVETDDNHVLYHVAPEVEGRIIRLD